MRIVLIGTFDSRGGAARAMYRQHVALRDAGIDSSIFCEEKSTADDAVIAFQPESRIGVRVKRVLRRVRLQRELNAALKGRDPKLEIFTHDQTMYSSELLEQIPDADIYNLHWINNFVDVPAILPQLCERAPVLWTLHDQNALTGGCHYTDGCTKCFDACGDCPQLGRSGKTDLSYRIRQRRNQVMEKIPADRLHFVALSRWMQQFVEQHPFGKKFGVSLVPNSVPTEVFREWDMETARGVFGFPNGKKVLLFVAEGLHNQRKGFQVLLDALQKIPPHDDFMMASAGNGMVKQFQTDHHWKNVGFINHEGSLALLYQAADLFVIPSREDNLPNTVLESMACGTPVAALPSGGIPDMVRPGQTGWLANGMTSDALAETIQQALSDREKLHSIGKQARQMVLQEFSPEKQVERLNVLFRDIVEKNG